MLEESPNPQKYALSAGNVNAYDATALPRAGGD
jgi:hypothetical protein